MFSFFRKKSPPTPPDPEKTVVPDATTVAPETLPPDVVRTGSVRFSLPGGASEDAPVAVSARSSWTSRLRAGLRRTGSSIASVFTGTTIDEALYEELESALVLADTGVKATQFLLDTLRQRVKQTKAKDPAAVKALLTDVLTELLTPLEKELIVGEFKPTVIMMVGVNGAGKTTSIGKLTRHLGYRGVSVLLAAADTFRAAAKEQLAVWAIATRSRSSASKVVTRPPSVTTP